MSTGGEVLVAVVIAVGLVGIIVPILPGTILVLGAIGFWCFAVGGPAAWAVGAAAVLAIGAAQLLKYLVPGRQLRSGGVPQTTLLVGAVLGIVGFFVVPVVGLVLGFVAGVYLAELWRARDLRVAASATWLAVKAAGVSIAIELAGGLLAAWAWLAGVVAT